MRAACHGSGRRPHDVDSGSHAAWHLPIGLPLPPRVHAHPSHHGLTRPVPTAAQLHSRATGMLPTPAALDEAVTASSMQNEAGRGHHHAEATTLPLPDPLPVMACRTHQLQAQVDLHAATSALRDAVGRLMHSYQGLRSGCVRVEVPIPRTSSALHWLAGQMHASRRAQPNKALHWPCVYFSCRHSSAPDTPSTAKAEACSRGLAALAGVGSAWHWHGQAAGGFDSVVVQQMQRFLSPDQPHIRILGGTRFDATTTPSEEWAPLGAYLFSLPLLEYSERGSAAVLACTLAWDTALGSHTSEEQQADATPVWGSGASSLDAAVDTVLSALQHMQPPVPPSAGAQQVQQVSWDHMPDQEQWHQCMQDLLHALRRDEQGDGEVRAAGSSNKKAGALDVGLAKGEYLTRGQQGLDDLLAAVGGIEARPSQVPGTGQDVDPAFGGDLTDPDLGSGTQLTKVVMARRTQLECTGQLDPLWMLEALQERDPRAYQLFISDGQGTAFVACTPERLYARTGRDVASEAVAATRARGPPGDIERDFWLSMELLNSSKDHHEFVLVRDWIRDALATCSVRVDVEVPKSVLKQGSMQHLYGKLAARLRPGVDDSQILRALHPTPAVCGRPRDDAKDWLRAQEQFDRGFYAGPFGWVSGEGAEFAVAIRSALFRRSTTQQQQHSVFLYAGVGVVQGSCPTSEWQELDLKSRPFKALLESGASVSSLPNVNVAWAYLLVEECCRQGINMFCIAPGSRSSPLAAAVASHPRARLNICIDERSLGFWALGYGRATGRPAVVITSSGTAVANLLPACVEASQSEVPLLLVTADRPGELRDTGANQTIDQVKIFGGYTRWFQDVAAPTNQVPGRALLTTISTACRFCTGAAGAAGPVHLNMQFREPLAPISSTWPQSQFMQGLDAWLANPTTPFTTNITTSKTAVSLQSSAVLDQACQRLWSAQRGLLVVGELTDPADATSVLALARHLRWPVAVDILSGLRTAQLSAWQDEGVCLVSYMDHLLLGDKSWWGSLAPDVVLQVGPRITSKRVNQFMEWLASDASSTWLYVGSSSCRHDAAHLVTYHLTVPVTALAQHLDTAASQAARAHSAPASLEAYRSLLQTLNQVAHDEIEAAISSIPALSEPAVARQLASLLPAGHALFLGNSMPIRDMDMYARPRHGEGLVTGLSTAANRGASGIDGVLSTAAGFAEGKSRPTTLVIGDLSFLHDSNGLNMLRAGEARPPLTVVLINNNGGGIFSFLPIHGALPKDQFEPLWATPQNADFEGLCRSHGLPYQRVSAGSGGDLEQALKAAWSLNRHSVVEVVTERNSNVQVHRQIQQRVQKAVQTAHVWASQQGGFTTGAQLSIQSVSWRRFELPLMRPLTSDAGGKQVRQGFTLQVTAQSSDGQVVTGLGEVAPLPGLHRDDMAACEAQLRLVAHQLPQQPLPMSLALLGGRLAAWMSTACLHPAEDLLPSVRYGLEMAVLDCLSHRRHQGSLLAEYMRDDEAVQVAGLVAADTAEQAAEQAVKLVQQHKHAALKIKVARRGRSPEHDAQVVLAVRAAVGPDVALRADANRGWSLSEACQFGSAVAPAQLEFVEEPTSDVREAPSFSEMTGIPFALDESIELSSAPPRTLIQELHKAGAGRLGALVLKPAALGGYEATLELATLATHLGLKVVISSCFEGPLGLAHDVELANAVDVMQAACRQQQQKPVCHGLGTLAWFSPACLPDASQRLHASTITRGPGSLASTLLTASCTAQASEQQQQQFTWANWTFSHQRPDKPTATIHASTVQHTASSSSITSTLLFLHGFMGCKEDWQPLMESLLVPGSRQCVSVDLPGHAGSAAAGDYSTEDMADLVADLISRQGLTGCTLVGYSMGARVALATAVRHGHCLTNLVCISGTPGIKDARQAHRRAAADKALADMLMERGLPYFITHWYNQSLWRSLRRSPTFHAMRQRRLQAQHSEAGLAGSLVHASTGRMVSMWSALPKLSTRLLIVTGESDDKFTVISNHMCKVAGGSVDITATCVPGAGHAVHVERPWMVVKAIRAFLGDEQDA